MVIREHVSASVPTDTRDIHVPKTTGAQMERIAMVEE